MNNQRSVAPAAAQSDHEVLVSNVAEAIRDLLTQMQSGDSPPQSKTAVFEALDAFANSTGRTLDPPRR